MHIFISYRRKDLKAAQRCPLIYEHLSSKFGEQSVFIDIDSLPPGVDFRNAIKRELNFTDIFISLVADQWLKILKANAKNEIDYVRYELEYAIEKNIPIVPVLIGENILMPDKNDLPDSISNFCFFNAFRLNELDINSSLIRLSNYLTLLYSRFEIRADLFGNYIRSPKPFNKNDDSFRNELETKAQRPDAKAEELFAWGKYVRDICLHVSEWGMALSAYEASAKKGFIPAMYSLGYEYEKGYSDPFLEDQEQLKFIQETIDYRQSAYWYKKAAEALFNRKRNL